MKNVIKLMKWLCVGWIQIFVNILAYPNKNLKKRGWGSSQTYSKDEIKYRQD